VLQPTEQRGFFDFGLTFDTTSSNDDTTPNNEVAYQPTSVDLIACQVELEDPEGSIPPTADTL